MPIGSTKQTAGKLTGINLISCFRPKKFQPQEWSWWKNVITTSLEVILPLVQYSWALNTYTSVQNTNNFI